MHPFWIKLNNYSSNYSHYCTFFLCVNRSPTCGYYQRRLHGSLRGQVGSPLIRIINESAWLDRSSFIIPHHYTSCILYFRVNALSFFGSNEKTKTALKRSGRTWVKKKERKSMSSDDSCRILPSCHMQICFDNCSFQVIPIFPIYSVLDNFFSPRNN